jgi:hypothetical protein
MAEKPQATSCPTSRHRSQRAVVNWLTATSIMIRESPVGTAP